MCHVWRKGEVFTVFQLGGPKGRDPWEDPGISGRIALIWALRRQGSMRQTGFG